MSLTAIVFAVVITCDREKIVPQGEGLVALAAGEFEAFPVTDQRNEPLDR
jgi:hypothetical protein|tara:strand:- start:1422 stop:1571 length:150 start_codon:yes stop_codon:yes gene_type:complete